MNYLNLLFGPFCAGAPFGREEAKMGKILHIGGPIVTAIGALSVVQAVTNLPVLTMTVSSILLLALGGSAAVLAIKVVVS